MFAEVGHGVHDGDGPTRISHELFPLHGWQLMDNCLSIVDAAVRSGVM